MEYSHTQHGKIHLILYASALGSMLIGLLCIAEPVAVVITLGTGALFVPLAFCFKTLTVSDQGDHILIQFGPLPVFRKRIKYSDCSDIKVGRTTFLHGWGIHGFWGVGWTYNLWGYDCVKLKCAGVRFNLGTDDPQGLAEFLNSKCA